MGGTGAMGKHLVDILVQNKENEVVVTTRSQRQDNDNLQYICGNAHNLDFLSNLLVEGWNYIVDFMSYTTEEFSQRVDLLLGATSHYFFLSSSRVYAGADVPLTEESPRLLDICKNEEYLSTDEYALAKARQENMLISNAMRNWTIIRPYITFSEDRLQLGEMEKEEWLFIALKRGVIPFSRDVADKVTTLTYGKDVATGIVRLMGQDDSLANIYHLTSGQAIKWSQVLDVYVKTLKEVLGKEIKVQYTDVSRNFTTIQKWQLQYDRLYDRVFSTNKLYLNEGNIPVPEILSNCLKAFLASNKKFHDYCWSKLGCYDREQGNWENVFGIPGWKNKARYIAKRLNLR